jgi:uncharacterized protein
VLQICRFAHTIALKNGFTFKSHMTTNGYFLHFNLFESLVDAGVSSFQISLDGTETEHNKTRRNGNAEGTFATIMNNLVIMRQSSRAFDVTLRLHVHDSNVKNIMELIDDITLSFGNDYRFKVTIQRIIDHGGERNNPVKLAGREASERVYDYLAGRLPSAQVLKVTDTFLCCYASLPNHFVIRSNGKIQKCTVALYDERNDVGELLLDGSIRWLDQRKMRAWSAGLFEGNLEKMLCPWKVMRRNDTAAKITV